MTAPEQICKNCGNRFVGKYCNACGEKVYTDKDKSVAHIFGEGFHFLTHLEGSFFKSLKYLFTRPGKLSEEYCYGRRKSLFKPISLFLLLVIIYLLFPVFEGLNMKLKYYLSNPIYGDWASQKINSIIAAKGWSAEQAADIFHAKAEKVSKLMLLVLLPLTALYFWLFTFKKRPLFFDQMIFATEVNSLYLIWGFMILPLLLTLYILVARLFGAHPEIGDGAIGIVMYAVLIVFVYLGSRRFFKLSLPAAVLLAIGFLPAHYLVVQIIYKLLLFSITSSLID